MVPVGISNLGSWNCHWFSLIDCVDDFVALKFISISPTKDNSGGSPQRRCNCFRQTWLFWFKMIFKKMYTTWFGVVTPVISWFNITLTIVISLTQKPQFLEWLITTTEAPPYIAGALAKWRHGRHKIIKWPTSTNHVLQAVKHCEEYLSQIFTVVTQSKSFRYSVAQSRVRN